MLLYRVFHRRNQEAYSYLRCCTTICLICVGVRDGATFSSRLHCESNYVGQMESTWIKSVTFISLHSSVIQLASTSKFCNANEIYKGTKLVD